MTKIAVRHIIDPIDVLIECIKHAPKSMGLEICVDRHAITIGDGCPYGKVEILLNTTNKSYYIPLQCNVTFENNQMHVEAYSLRDNIVDKDHYYTATYDLKTPVKIFKACQNIDMIYRILLVYTENLKTYTSYTDAETYAAYAISNTIDSFKSYFEPVEL